MRAEGKKGRETEREDDRLRWRRRKSVVMRNARCESDQEQRGRQNGRGSVGGMSLFPHLSHAQMFGEVKGKIGGLGPELGNRKKVKETTSEGEVRGNVHAEGPWWIDPRIKDGE